MITASNPSIGLIKLGFTPEVDFRLVQNDSSIFIEEWFSGSAQPTDAAIDAATIEAQAEYDALEYARLRKAKYDALNQFELISDDAINGTTTHKDAILAIKAEFPKP